MANCFVYTNGLRQFDADAVAAELGFKDGSIARVRWNSINRLKIQDTTASPAGVKKTTSTKKSASKKRKYGDSGEGDEDELGNGTGTPTKTPKKRARRSKADAAGEKDENGVRVKEENMEDVVETTEKDSEDELAA